MSASGATWTIDSGVVTSAKIADGTIVDGDISATAEIAVSKLADGTARQLLQTDAAGTGVEWTSNVDIPGTLDVTSTATFDGNISFPLGTAALPSIYPGTNTNTGFWRPAADTLAISNGGTETLRTDSSQRLLVGTTTARTIGGVTPRFQIQGVNSTSFSSLGFFSNSPSGDVASIYFGRSGAASAGSVTIVPNGEGLGGLVFTGADGTQFINGASIFAIVDGTPGTNDLPTRLVFSLTPDGSATPTEAMRINNQRELLLGVTTRNANGGVLQLKSGITFPATQVAATDANTLDDYEEGTFTPTIVGTTVGGTGTYSSQVGNYTKIGNLVNVALQIVWTAHTGTGNMRVAGLPFTSATGIKQVGSCTVNNMTSPLYTLVLVELEQSNTQLRMISETIAAGISADLAMDTAATLTITVTYRV